MAVEYSDAVIYAAPKVNQRLMNYAETKGKPILPYIEQEDPVQAAKRQYDFFNTLLPAEEEDY